MAESPKITRHFTVDEFRCKCCHDVVVYGDLLIGLEHLRYMAGNKPLRIVSGYRCPKYNRKCGGSKQSMHMQGLAADIWTGDPGRTDLLREIAIKIPEFTDGGIGWYETFLHVDCRWVLGKRRARWGGR